MGLKVNEMLSSVFKETYVWSGFTFAFPDKTGWHWCFLRFAVAAAQSVWKSTKSSSWATRPRSALLQGEAEDLKSCRAVRGIWRELPVQVFAPISSPTLLPLPSCPASRAGAEREDPGLYFIARCSERVGKDWSVCIWSPMCLHRHHETGAVFLCLTLAFYPVPPPSCTFTERADKICPISS